MSPIFCFFIKDTDYSVDLNAYSYPEGIAFLRYQAISMHPSFGPITLNVVLGS